MRKFLKVKNVIYKKLKLDTKELTQPIWLNQPKNGNYQNKCEKAVLSEEK